MGKLVRFGVSMEEVLLREFDRLLRKRGYGSRSEAVRDLVRDALVRQEWEEDQEVVGVITLVYEHHRRELTARLTEVQHHHHDLVAAAMHIHLDEENCLEIIAVRGPGPTVQALADTLIAQKGVKHGQLSATATGARLP